MEYSTNLPVLAEIAIGLAGFMGIVGALRRRSGEGLSDRERVHTGILLMAAVIVLIFALLPNWLWLRFEDESQVWRWSLRLLTGAHSVSWVVFIPLARGGAVLAQLPRIERNFLFFFTGLGAVVLTFEIFQLWEGSPTRAPFVYEGALLFWLTVGVFNFFSLVLGPRD